MGLAFPVCDRPCRSMADSASAFLGGILSLAAVILQGGMRSCAAAVAAGMTNVGHGLFAYGLRRFPGKT
jgi:hypothetical protein